MNELMDILLSAGLWVSVLRIATPLIFGTLGALYCERAGVLNLGIEGIMTFGAMIGWLTVFNGADLWIGVLAAAASGAVFGLLHAALTVPLGLSQHVVGRASRCLLRASATSCSVFWCHCLRPRLRSRHSSRSIRHGLRIFRLSDKCLVPRPHSHGLLFHWRSCSVMCSSALPLVLQFA